MMRERFAGRQISVYCNHCRWTGEVTIPRNYEPPRCGPMEQSCQHCGHCHLHPMPEAAIQDIVHGIGMPIDPELADEGDDD